VLPLIAETPVTVSHLPRKSRQRAYE
jgi:hypothetical protein